MEKRVHMRDVAAVAGVSVSTVSRVMRNDVRITEEVKARVRASAQKLGYTPDPMLRALADYRAINRRREFHGLLAWLTNFPTREGWRKHEKIGYLAGATQRALEFGYKLEIFWAREPEVTPARLRQILLARGILGVLLPPQPAEKTRMDLRLDGLAAISFGRSLCHPVLHVVHHHHYRSMRRLLTELANLGYRRPGLAMADWVHRNVEEAWAAAWMIHGAEHGLELPPMHVAETLTPTGILRWYRDHKPDVVISHEGDVLSWLRAAGVRVPKDCGFALPAKHAGAPECAGIDENNEMTGAIAVESLVNAIQHGETGVPKHTRSILIEGTWFAGSTVRRLSRAGQVEGTFG